MWILQIIRYDLVKGCPFNQSRFNTYKKKTLCITRNICFFLKKKTQLKNLLIMKSYRNENIQVKLHSWYEIHWVEYPYCGFRDQLVQKFRIALRKQILDRWAKNCKLREKVKLNLLGKSLNSNTGCYFLTAITHVYISLTFLKKHF